MKEEETSGISNTAWLATAKPLKFSQLKKDISADCVIVGGGISGMTAAYFLSEQGKKVAVVEDGFLGSGETGRTTAHISYVFDMDFSEFLKINGKERAKLAVQSHRDAIRIIENIVYKEKIDCDFEIVPGYLYGNHDEIKKELEALYSLDFHEVKFADIPVKTIKSKGLFFPEQAQFHSLKYLHGLAKAVLRNGGHIFTETHATKIDKTGITSDNGFRVNASKIFVATNSPVNNISLFLKEAPYRTYVIAGTVPINSFPKALLWDMEDPYHYVRTQKYNKTSDLLIIGGEDHRTGQKNDGKKRWLILEKWARSHFPMLDKIKFRWSGQVMESYDGFGFIGLAPGKENIYIATGDCGSGITHGTIAGKLISDMIVGRRNPWKEIYNPKRKNTFLTKGFLKDTGKMVGEYFKWFEIEHVYPQLKSNEGMIVQAGMKKVAAYKDKKGKVHLHSAVCPHLGCVVQWNDAEKSFDCPCHGSRFSAEGKVVHGPANKNLNQWKEKPRK